MNIPVLLTSPPAHWQRYVHHAGVERLDYRSVEKNIVGWSGMSSLKVRYQ